MIKWDKLTEYIDNSENIILSTHRDPDGDGLGSEISFYYYLKSIDKNVTIVNISDTPTRYKFLDEESVIQVYSDNSRRIVSESDLLIVFDLGDYSRIGEIGKIVLDNSIASVNIDHHHLRDDSMYSLSLVDTKSPSTTYMIWKYFEHLNMNNVPLADNIAIALYAGLVNDTGSFRYSSVTSDSHNMAAHLLESQVDPNMIFTNIYENITMSAINLKAAMIKNIRLSNNGQVGYAIIDEDMFKETESSYSNAEGFSEFLRGINGVEISFCLTETPNGFKISFRSSGTYNINDIAAIFGGGGHFFAAGCSVNKEDLDKTIKIILTECDRKINNGN